VSQKTRHQAECSRTPLRALVRTGFSVCAIVSCLLLAGCSRDTRGLYLGHRVFLWGIDKQTGGLVEFSSAVVEPGDKMVMTLSGDNVVSLSLGRVITQELSDGEREWEEPGIEFTISSAAGGGTSGSMDLTTPNSTILYNARAASNTPHVVAFMLPLGTSAFPEIDKMLAGKFEGKRPGLEDLLLVAVKQGAGIHDYIDLPDLVFAYRILKKSDRVAEWTEMMNGKDEYQAIIASSVLLILNNAAGKKRFHQFCLTTTGDIQEDLVDLLLREPPSDQVLATIVALLKAGKPGRDPGSGEASEDMRYPLLEALTDQYPYEKTKVLMEEILQSESGFGKQHIRKHMQGKQ